MELALSGSLLRSFFKSVGCLAKIGAEVLVEASAGTGLTLKSMNSARSAFCSVTFKQSSFEVFAVPNGTVQTAVLAKHLAAALRTQRLERVVLSQAAGESSTLRVRLECSRSGLTKHYGLHCVTDAEHLKATVDASLMPISLILKPKEFSRLLSHFQSAQTDVTVSFTPEQTNHPNASGKDFSGGFGDRRHEKENSRNLRLSSFADPNAPPGQHLQTSIGLDAAEDAVLRYTHEKDASETAGVGPSTSTSTDVTVNLKDLRAMVQFCESVDLDVAIYADSAGAPMLVRPCAEFRGAGHGRGEYGTGRGEGGGSWRRRTRQQRQLLRRRRGGFRRRARASVHASKRGNTRRGAERNAGRDAARGRGTRGRIGGADEVRGGNGTKGWAIWGGHGARRSKGRDPAGREAFHGHRGFRFRSRRVSARAWPRRALGGRAKPKRECEFEVGTRRAGKRRRDGRLGLGRRGRLRGSHAS